MSEFVILWFSNGWDQNPIFKKSGSQKVRISNGWISDPNCVQMNLDFGLHCILIVTRLLCLVKSYTLDAAVRRERSLFTSFTFCNMVISCSLIPKENKCCVHLPVFY